MVAAAVVGAAVIGGVTQSVSADRASKQQRKGADAATQLQADIFEQQREDFAPWRQVGTAALNRLAGMYGLPQYTPPPAPGTTPAAGTPATPATPVATTTPPISGHNVILTTQRQQQAAQQGATPAIPAPGAPAPSTTTPAPQPNYSDFYKSPDYQFAQEEGLKGVQAALAARGALMGGGAQREIARYSSGLASQQFNNYSNRLAALAGVGQTATSQLANLGSAYGQSAGQSMMAAGNARASGYQGQGDAWGNALGSIAYGFGRGGYGTGAGAGGGGFSMDPNLLSSIGGLNTTPTGTF